MTTLALSVLRGIVENGLEMEKVYVYLPQVNAAFSNIFASILLRSPISRQRLCVLLVQSPSTAISPVEQRSLMPRNTQLVPSFECLYRLPTGLSSGQHLGRAENKLVQGAASQTRLTRINAILAGLKFENIESVVKFAFKG